MPASAACPPHTSTPGQPRGAASWYWTTTTTSAATRDATNTRPSCDASAVWLIGYGGTQSIDHPPTFSPQAQGRPGRDRRQASNRSSSYYDQTFYETPGIVNSASRFFDKETWGSDYLAVRQTRHAASAPTTPSSSRTRPCRSRARRTSPCCARNPKDWLPGLTQAAEVGQADRAHLRAVADRLRQGRSRTSMKYLSKASSGYWGYGADGIGAIDAWADWYPGFDGLGLSWAKPYKVQRADGEAVLGRRTTLHLPLPRRLPRSSRVCWCASWSPTRLPGRTMEDEVLARLDYARLDQPRKPYPHPTREPRCAKARIADAAGRSRSPTSERRAAQRQGQGRGDGLLVLDDALHRRGASRRAEAGDPVHDPHPAGLRQPSDLATGASSRS